MGVKSGTPTGAGTPSGTAAQREYYGASRTPSGTPRTATRTPRFKAALRKDIEADPSKYNLEDYSYLYPEGYPYAIKGKAVSKGEWEKYYRTTLQEYKVSQELLRKQRQREAYRVGKPSITREDIQREEQLQQARRQIITQTYTPEELKRFIERATPSEQEDFLRGTGWKPEDLIFVRGYRGEGIGKEGTLLLKIKTPEGEIQILDPSKRLKVQAERSLQRKLTKEEEKSFLERVKRKPNESYITWSRRTQKEIKDWRYRTIESGERKLQEFISKKVSKYEETPFIKRIPRREGETYTEWSKRSQEETKKLGKIALGSMLMLYPSIVSTIGKIEAKPVKAITEELIELKQFPTAFKERPIETTVGVAASIGAGYLTGVGIKEYKIKKQPKIKVKVSKKVIVEKDPIKKGVKYYREQNQVKVYEKIKNRWRLKETLTPEAFYETYGIREIGIAPIIKDKAQVTFYTKTGQRFTQTFSKDLLSIIERTALGKQPTLAVGGILIKRGKQVYTGDLVGVGRRLGRKETFGLADVTIGKDSVSGIGVSRKLIKLYKDGKVLEIGREVGVAKGTKVKDVFFGEYIFKPLTRTDKKPVTFLAPNVQALERISKLKYYVPSQVVEKAVKEIVTPEVKFQKGILVGGFFVGREGIEELTKIREQTIQPSIFVSETTQIYKPREEFMMGIGAGQIVGIKSQIKQTTSAIQQEKERIKQIPKEDVMQIQSAQQKLAYLQQQKVLQRQEQKQAQKQLQQLKQVQAQTQTVTTMITPTIITDIPFTFITKKPSTLLSAIKKIEKKVPSFELFIKRKGKFKKIGEFEKAKAIKLGTKITRETLAATFMIKPTKKLIVSKPSKLELPSPEIFRAYKIIKGRKVPLEFTWIQKRGKRLGTPSEVSEIQMARTSFFKTSKKRIKSGGITKWF